VTTIGLLLLLLAGPGTVSVPSDSLVAAAVRCVRARLATERVEYDVNVRSVPEPVTLEGARCTLDATVDGLPPEGGQVTVRVEARSDRGRQRTAYVSLKIRRFTTVAVAAGNIERQQERLDEAVRFEQRETTGIREGLIRSADDLRAMRSRRMIPEGAMVTAQMIERKPIVRPNASVVIRVRTGSVVLSAAGTARDEGRRGETIGITRQGSHDVFRGTVVDSATVDVRIP
jgi:flagella basal body P-ring formation protein FlgA